MGHWYEKDGTPKHWQEDGKDTTLRHARKQNLYPSVTTVGNIKAKFNLTQWLQEEAAMMAAQMIGSSPQVEDWMTYYERDWAKEVVKASREKTMEKADAGTDIHDILERWMNSEEVAEEHIPMCQAVDDLIAEKTGGMNDFQTETRFCDTGHGYAGMCDLHNEHWIIDYKSKDTVDAKTKGWKEQAEQLAAYAHGLGYPNARLANVFISREDPTQVVWYEHQDELAWERFRHALMLWQIENKYGPHFEALK